MSVSNQQIRQLAQRLEANFPEIYFAYLFGTANKGELSANSDIDIAVYLKQDSKTTRLIAGIIGEVENIIPDHYCDLTILNDAGKLVAMEALKGKIIFIRKEAKNLHSEFYSLTCRMYEDQQAWIKKQLKYRGYEVQWDH